MHMKGKVVVNMWKSGFKLYFGIVAITSLQDFHVTGCNAEHDWVTHGGYDYCIRWQLDNFEEAKKECRIVHANLTSIENVEEHNFLVRNLTKNKGEYWIGLQKNESERTDWYWIDGTMYHAINVTTLWGSITGGNENCARLNGDKWQDIGCDKLFDYICKREIEKDVMTTKITKYVTDYTVNTETMQYDLFFTTERSHGEASNIPIIAGVAGGAALIIIVIISVVIVILRRKINEKNKEENPQPYYSYVDPPLKEKDADNLYMNVDNVDNVSHGHPGPQVSNPPIMHDTHLKGPEKAKPVVKPKPTQPAKKAQTAKKFSKGKNKNKPKPATKPKPNKDAESTLYENVADENKGGIVEEYAVVNKTPKTEMNEPNMEMYAVVNKPAGVHRVQPAGGGNPDDQQETDYYALAPAVPQKSV